MKKIVILILSFFILPFWSSAQTLPSDTILYKDLKRLTSRLSYGVGTGPIRDNIKLNQQSIANVKLPLENFVQKWADEFKDWKALKKTIDEKIGSRNNEFLNSYRAYIISSQSYFLEDHSPDAIEQKIILIDDLLKNGGSSFHVYYALLSSIKSKASNKEFKDRLEKVLRLGAKKFEENNNNVLGTTFFKSDSEVDVLAIEESNARIQYYYFLIKKF